ncbi:MAG: hotdog domain-containing protein [Phycisphaerae bacterium]
MRPGLKPGVSRSLEFLVRPDMRPAFDDVPVHNVCSTWTLAHQMEIAGRMVLKDFLEPHEEGVGSHVSVDHVSPGKVGCTVRVTATATEVTERKLVCDMVAEVGERLIARGKTVQNIFPRDVLERILERE